MSKVKAPFLSLGAVGSVAQTLTSSTWKGLKTIRQHAVPANPRTAAQVSQRSSFAAAVAAFRAYLTSTDTRAALNRAAARGSRTQSGYNLIVSAISQALTLDPDASFAVACTAAANQVLAFSMLNMDDGATGDEAGDFEIWSGSAAGSLLLAGTASIAAGVVTSPDLGDEGDIVYAQLRKGGIARSGIYQKTLAADAPTADYVVTGTLSPDATGDYVENGTYDGRAAYERADGAYWLWFNGDTTTYHISQNKDDGPTFYWENGDPDFPAGSYSPFGTASGTATVAAP